VATCAIGEHFALALKEHGLRSPLYLVARTVLNKGWAQNMSCKCQGCGKPYQVDLVVDDELWDIIKPEGKPSGGGLLCPLCIMLKIENLGTYKLYKLVTQ
jgi:hypothetical protein